MFLDSRQIYGKWWFQMSFQKNKYKPISELKVSGIWKAQQFVWNVEYPEILVH